MPLTPFHLTFPWIPYARWSRLFSFWAASWGAMVPDIEVVPMFLVSRDVYVARGIMHSVLGVLTVNALVTVLIVQLVMPRVLRWTQRMWSDPSHLRFAGQDLRKDPKGLPTLYTSAAFGGLTHILIDIPVHSYNPILWPWQTVPFNILPFTDQLWWDALTGAIFFVAFLATAARFWRR